MAAAAPQKDAGPPKCAGCQGVITPHHAACIICRLGWCYMCAGMELEEDEVNEYFELTITCGMCVAIAREVDNKKRAA